MIYTYFIEGSRMRFNGIANWVIKNDHELIWLKQKMVEVLIGWKYGTNCIKTDRGGVYLLIVIYVYLAFVYLK